MFFDVFSSKSVRESGGGVGGESVVGHGWAGVGWGGAHWVKNLFF